MLAGRAGRAQLSTAGANLAELGRDPAAYRTVIEYMVHTFNDREEWLICSFHRALPPIFRAPRSGGEQAEGNTRAGDVSSFLDTRWSNRTDDRCLHCSEHRLRVSDLPFVVGDHGSH